MDPKEQRTESAAGTDTEESVMNKRRSSAYRDTFCSYPQLTIPLICGSARSGMERGSIATANKRGLGALNDREESKKTDYYLS